MVADIPGKIIMRSITDGHKNVTMELSGCYFIQFMPDLHLHQGKPALRVSQRLYSIHEHHNSSDFFQFIGETQLQEHRMEGWHSHPSREVAKLLCY